ncbi:hypothetical protein JCM19233_5303 [Vibrio astriarenae]|nr:hypothetical protein JCM19233_5303 [Vibrio sp. C7]
MTILLNQYTQPQVLRHPEFISGSTEEAWDIPSTSPRF